MLLSAKKLLIHDRTWMLQTLKAKNSCAKAGIIAVSILTFATVLATFFFCNPPAFNVEKSSFRTYWSACQLIGKDQNPYDQSALQAVMNKAGAPWAPEVNYYNPPWLLPLICPLGQMGLNSSYQIYKVICVLLLCLFSVSLARSSHHPYSLLFIGIATAANVPLLLAASDGQSAFLMAAFSYWLYTCVRKDWHIGAGISLAFMSAKPHLIIGLATYLLLPAGKDYNRKRTVSFVLSLLALLVTAEVVAPGSFSAWIGVMAGKSEISSPPIWLGSTATGWLMAATGNAESANSGVAYAVTMTGIIISAYLRLRSKVKEEVAVPLLLLFSSIMAPYGYIYDQTSGSLLAFATAEQLDPKNRLRLLATWLFLNLALLISMKHFAAFYHQLAWFGFTSLIIFILFGCLGFGRWSKN